MGYTETIQDGMVVRTYENGTVEKFPVPAEEPEPEPVFSSVFTKLEFLSLFTPTELAAFLAAAQQDPTTGVFKMMLDAASAVDVADPRTMQAVQGMEQAGLIQAGRADEILNARKEIS